MSSGHRATSKGGAIVGRYRLDPIVEFEGPRMPPSAMFPAVDPQRLEALLLRVPEDSFDRGSRHLVTSVHAWLIRASGGPTILVDTCFGNLKQRPGFPFFHMQRTDWLERLAALGVEPGDVTHVVNTHVHHDHVGWNTVLDGGVWRPTFPRARYLLPRIEVELGPQGTPDWNKHAFADSVAPIVADGLADLVDPPHPIAPGLRLVACPGHSPGMMVAELSDGGETVMVGADPMHHPLQVFAPDANSGFCEDPERSAAARRAFLADCADHGKAIASTHLYVPRVMRVRRAGDGFDLVR